MALTACGRSEPVHQARQFVFGTFVDIRIHGGGPAAANAAMARVMTEFDSLHARWHAWNGDGALARVNASLANDGVAQLPEDLQKLVRDGLALARSSDGLFDPAIGGLSALWGFHTDTPPAERPPPAAAELDTWLADPPSWRHLQVNGGHLVSSHPDVRLDFGAHAKGVALERARALLEDAGVDNALVNAGGDLVALGRRGDRPWRIGIQRPGAGDVLASLDLTDGEAVVTSGDYERGFSYGGRDYHHILDPRTGRPARGARSVTVLHDHAGVADAAATALFVAGPGAWPAVAAAMDVTQVMLVTDDGTVEITPAMQTRIRFENGHAPAVTILSPSSAAPP